VESRLGQSHDVALESRFEVSAALRDADVVEQACAIAGRDVRLRCDARLLPWLGPLCGLPARGSRIALTIELAVADLGPEVTETRVLPSTDGRLLLVDQPGARIVLDRLAGCLSARVALDGLQRWERAKPLSLPLTVWFSDLGLLAVHAGVVARKGAALLFAGPSGSGKSTCSLACAAAGFDFLADDYVVCDPSKDFICHAVYSSAALDPQGLARIGTPRATGEVDKVIVTAGEAPMPRVTSTAHPVALVLPRIAGAHHTRVRVASSGEALARLAPSSILRRAVPAAQTLKQLAGLVAALPAYWLDMSADPREVPGVAAALLEELA